MLTLIKVTMLVASLPGIVTSPGSQEPGREAHGEFTGAIKPVLYVSDVEASAAFFRDVLGFGFDGFANLSDGTPYYAEMLAGTQKFGLHEPTVEGQITRIGEARLYFRVRDVEAHRQRIVARGVEAGEIIRTDWMDMCIVRDPDGHEIVFAETDPERHSIDPWTFRAPARRS